MIKILTLWLLCYSLVFGVATNTKTLDQVTVLDCGNGDIVYSVCVNGKECITVDKILNIKLTNETNDTVLNIINYAYGNWFPVDKCTLSTSEAISTQTYHRAYNIKHTSVYIDLLKNANSLSLKRENIK